MLKERVRECTTERKHETLSRLSNVTNSHIPTVRTFTHRAPRIHDRERGTKTKVAGKVNVVERVGYTVDVKFGKVCTDLLQLYYAHHGVRDYETLS
jgi:hypothetical protein